MDEELIIAEGSFWGSKSVARSTGLSTSAPGGLRASVGQVQVNLSQIYLLFGGKDAQGPRMQRLSAHRPPFR